MGSGAVDSSQWLSVKEETIFLHDGLIRVTDLAELPSEIGVSEQGDTEQEVSECHLTQAFVWDVETLTHSCGCLFVYFNVKHDMCFHCRLQRTLAKCTAGLTLARSLLVRCWPAVKEATIVK